jgi:UDP-N-acetylglucosamine--N-acetylmuramyl-(pentapeptide) pyrophosphoryl-undecaprenol N-acetylglucosamine transferase
MPALATTEALAELLPDAEFLFMFPRRIAGGIKPGETLSLKHVVVPAPRIDGSFHKLTAPLKTCAAFASSIKHYRRFRPDIVVGLGGYGCVMPVLAAKALSLPIMLFESNAIPGKAVSYLSRLADSVQVQWPETAEKLSCRRTIATGNPVRSQLLRRNRADGCQRLRLDPNRTTLLVMGGSQGALDINCALVETLEHVAAGHNLFPEGLQILHLTGRRHLHRMRDISVPSGIIYRPMGYLDSMEDAYAAADFALSRAGGSTLAELTATGTPSILVPYPHATDNHQEANAQILAEAGAAFVISQDDLEPESLAVAIHTLATDTRLRERMGRNARKLGRPNAARDVAIEIASLAGVQIPVRAETDDRVTSIKKPLSRAA